MDLNVEKGISLVTFFLVTLVPGSTVVLLFRRCQERLTARAGRRVMSLLKCFAGGVFFSTCLLSLLEEGLEEYRDFRETANFQVPYPFFHLGIGVGFFLVAFMERLAFCISSHDRHQDTQEKQLQKDGPPSDAECLQMDPVWNQGETNKQQEAAKLGGGEAITEFNKMGLTDITAALSLKDTAGQNERHTDADAAAARDINQQQQASRKRPSRDGEISVEEEATTSGIRAIIFLLALSFHTLFDGLAVGLQTRESEVWAMTVAIAIHKVIMVTSLALELSLSLPGRPAKAVLLLFLFALMTPVGVAIGMSVRSGYVDQRAQLLAGSVLQAVAAGSVLYVTFFEILGEELGHQSSLVKVSITVLGFAAIAVAKIWDTD